MKLLVVQTFRKFVRNCGAGRWGAVGCGDDWTRNGDRCWGLAAVRSEASYGATNLETDCPHLAGGL